MATLIVLIGLPGSGKSTVAQNLQQRENAVIHSSDKLREELFGDVNECNKNDELFTELHKRIKQDLLSGKNVIYDATNVSRKKRKAFLDNFKKINCYKECYLIATPYEQCLIQNNQRERKVPEYVIKNMYKNFFIPQFYEGWNKINIEWNTDREYDVHELFNRENGLNEINQDNPHHTLTIGKHCEMCSDLISKQTNNQYLIQAGYLHDIGKAFTKEFKNGKGEVTETATYYQHHLVSAYDSMFYLKNMDYADYEIIHICNYIQWHMQPFFIETEKAREKFISLVGKAFYNDLMILHECDKRAK